jgi:hypothetical protein
MDAQRFYTVDQARDLLPVIRATLLQLAVERRRADADGSLQVALLEHLGSLGVVVRDLDAGLVDIPTLHDGEAAWLCWRLADAELGFWHSTREGFATRRPL